MAKRRYLDTIVPIDVAVADNTYIKQPYIEDEVLPNLIYSRNNPNFSNVDVGYNRFGELIDYRTGDPISIEDARQKVKSSWKDDKLQKAKDIMLDMSLDRFRNKKKYNLFSAGGSIYIKPENRGKFTATMKRTGKSAEELSHSKNPLTRKRAIFALNARKWKH